MFSVKKNRPKKIILFDGDCNLCNRSVLYIIKHDTKEQFNFAALSSETGQQIAKQLNIDLTTSNTLLLYESPKTGAVKSTAVLKIAIALGGWRKIAIVAYLIPVAIRDLLYTFIANHRIAWFGKNTTCIRPTKELESKFLK